MVLSCVGRGEKLTFLLASHPPRPPTPPPLIQSEPVSCAALDTTQSRLARLPAHLAPQALCLDPLDPRPARPAIQGLTPCSLPKRRAKCARTANFSRLATPLRPALTARATRSRRPLGRASVSSVLCTRGRRKTGQCVSTAPRALLGTTARHARPITMARRASPARGRRRAAAKGRVRRTATLSSACAILVLSTTRACATESSTVWSALPMRTARAGHVVPRPLEPSAVRARKSAMGMEIAEP